MRRPPSLARRAVGAAALLLAPTSALAQQAIVSLPSADVTPAREFFLMHETQARPWGPNRYWNTTNFFCYGLGSNTELALTTYNLGLPDSRLGSVAAGFKTAFPLFQESAPRWEVRATTGLMAMIPLVEQRPVEHWFYWHLSARLPGARTRFTLGVTHGGELMFGRRDTLSVMAAVEQPLFGDRIQLVLEWFSGAHDLGNLIGGVLFHPNHTWVFVLGYKVPTGSAQALEEKHGFVAEVGVFF